MVDVSEALLAKSDQLNAVDIVGAEPVITVREVDYNPKREQPIWIYFDGDNGRPWKPSKGMARIIKSAWTPDSDNWIGKHVKIYVEPTVKWAGKEVGGIQIRAMSHLPPGGIRCIHTKNRSERVPYHVPLLKIEEKEYPADKFEAAFGKMQEAMASGSMTLAQIVAQCQKTGQLTPAQLARLEEAAPVEVGDDDDNHEDEVY